MADDGDLLPLEEAELDDAHYHRVLAPVTLPDGPVVLGIILLCIDSFWLRKQPQ